MIFCEVSQTSRAQQQKKKLPSGEILQSKDIRTTKCLQRKKDDLTQMKIRLEVMRCQL